MNNETIAQKHIRAIKRNIFSHMEHDKWHFVAIYINTGISKFDKESEVLSYTLSLVDENDKNEVFSYLEFHKDKKIDDIANEILKVIHDNKGEILSDYGLKLKKDHIRRINSYLKAGKSFKIDLLNESASFI